MPNSDDRRSLSGSLDRIEFIMDLEETITVQINSDPSLTTEQRYRILRELDARILRLEEGDNLDDLDDSSPLSIYVRKLGPTGPGSRSGSIALQPDIEPDDPTQDRAPGPLSHPRKGPSDYSAGLR